MTPTYFTSQADFRHWLESNHCTTMELCVGFHKKHSGLGGMTYRQAVDEALCFGWIDGVVHRIDGNSYCHRFTPRKPGSIWSKVNVGHASRLTKASRMRPAGLKAFAARQENKTGIYSFEQKAPASFPPSLLQRFRAHEAAWTFFAAQAPWYRRQITHWVVSAKQQATRERRLAKAIMVSAAQKRL